MNFFLGIICIFICTFIGYLLSSKYKDRHIFYEDFYNFNNLLKNEISYTKNTIVEILNNYKNNDNDFYKIIIKCICEKKEFSFPVKYISDDEKIMFMEYVENIGMGDVDSQASFFDLSNNRIKDLLKSAKDEEKKYKNLYIKLGVLSGLVLFIILL